MFPKLAYFDQNVKKNLALLGEEIAKETAAQEEEVPATPAH